MKPSCDKIVLKFKAEKFRGNIHFIKKTHPIVKISPKLLP